MVANHLLNITYNTDGSADVKFLLSGQAEASSNSKAYIIYTLLFYIFYKIYYSFIIIKFILKNII